MGICKNGKTGECPGNPTCSPFGVTRCALGGSRFARDRTHPRETISLQEFVDECPTPTPIANAFAYGRAVMPDALALIRRLERERAECLLLLASIARTDAEAIAAMEALGVEVPESSRVLGRAAQTLVEKYRLTV